MKLWSVLFGVFYINICCADITCYLDVVKASCWNDFEVEVSVVNMKDRSIITKATIEKGNMWKRVSFPCQPGETLHYNVVYSPVFWEADKGKIYYATQYWSLPKAIKSGDVAWQLKICFPKNFSGVPVPPTAGSNCACQYDAIEPLKLEVDTSTQN